MHHIDSQTNNIVQLKEERFGELGFTEQGHLQEWIAKCPSSLGEELLIIQKEYDGFDEARVQLDLIRASREENKQIFDWLKENQAEIEAAFGETLDWQRLDAKKASRIAYSAPFDGFSHEVWREMIEWLVRHMLKLETAFKPQLAQVGRKLKSGT